MFVVFVEILMWLLLAVVLMCYSDAIPAYDPDTQECLNSTSGSSTSCRVTGFPRSLNTQSSRSFKMLSVYSYIHFSHLP